MGKGLLAFVKQVTKKLERRGKELKEQRNSKGTQREMGESFWGRRQKKRKKEKKNRQSLREKSFL